MTQSPLECLTASLDILALGLGPQGLYIVIYFHLYQYIAQCHFLINPLSLRLHKLPTRGRCITAYRGSFLYLSLPGPTSNYCTTQNWGSFSLISLSNPQQWVPRSIFPLSGTAYPRHLPQVNTQLLLGFSRGFFSLVHFLAWLTDSEACFFDFMTAWVLILPLQLLRYSCFTFPSQQLLHSWSYRLFYYTSVV